jgi:ubiquinone/menaquinone biosynthesis C-methylase UbiE
MERIPEPELMDQEAQARAYAEADFSDANRRFLRLFAEVHPVAATGLALDLGCGPADIVLRFARAHPHCRIDALDGSAAMLAHAAAALAGEPPELRERVRLLHRRLPAPDLPSGGYDHLLSNSLLHHLHDPQVLWGTLRRCGRPGATVLVMDLARPPSPAAADALTRQYAADAPEVLRRDFRNSLGAAFTPTEVQAQLAAAGLDGLRVERVSDRHLAVRGFLP